MHRPVIKCPAPSATTPTSGRHLKRTQRGSRQREGNGSSPNLFDGRSLARRPGRPGSPCQRQALWKNGSVMRPALLLLVCIRSARPAFACGRSGRCDAMSVRAVKGCRPRSTERSEQRKDSSASECADPGSDVRRSCLICQCFPVSERCTAPE